MNWKEFKDAVESQGVTDDMKIWYIDVDESPICVDIDDLGLGVMIS